MKRKYLPFLLTVFLIPCLLHAQDKKVKVKVEVEVDLEDVKSLSEVPNTLDAAREAGSTEAEIHKGYSAMKAIYIKGKPSLKVAEHFKTQAESGYSDEGLGDIIKECIDKGMKDEALVRCVLGKTGKKVKKHPVTKAIPVTKPVITTPLMKPDKTPPPDKLQHEAQHVGEATGALKGKKIGGKIKR